jgi:recombination protein RecA
MASSQELKNLLNATLKRDVAKMADDEVYDAGLLPTGLLPFDVLMSGGWAKGRMGLVAGESATLKSLVVLASIAQTQASGGTAALFDAEHSFNRDWAKKIGVNVEDLILIQPESGEVAIDGIEVLIRNEIDFIGVDSIAALLPESDRAIMLSGKDNPQPARIAALMSIALRKLTAANKKSTITWITQMRANIGGMAFSPKTLQTGGKSIGFYSSQTLEIKKTGKTYMDLNYFDGSKEQTDKQIVGQNFRVELTKSRLGQPFKLSHFEYDLINGAIDIPGYLIAQGLDMGIITKKGAWWNIIITNADGEVTYENKAGSKDKFHLLVAEDLELQNKLIDIICTINALNPELYYAKA